MSKRKLYTFRAKDICYTFYTVRAESEEKARENLMSYRHFEQGNVVEDSEPFDIELLSEEEEEDD